jgi:uncharacterized membrane protein YccF (DUF307 family)
MTAMQLLGNLLWFVIAGFGLFCGYVGAGLIQCLTIIGIPFGIQSFKLAVYTAWPFGRVVVTLPGDGGGLSCLGNVVWLLLGGIWLALWHLVVGLLLCLTIVGIPFGIACMRMASLALSPFGKSILTTEELARLRQPYTLVIPAINSGR